MVAPHAKAIALLMALPALASCTTAPQTTTTTAPSKTGYFDASGPPLQDRNPILARLDAEFSGACPQKITVTENREHPSEFHPRSSTIELGTDADKNGMVLTHETTHLCMASLTRGASNTEPYRFYDEGFASIVGGGKSPAYRKRALATAARKAAKGEVGFAKAQKWSTYFGDPPHADYDAYDVGASFVFFVEDVYGEKRLFAFFRSTGSEKTLDAATRKAFGESADAVETQWLAYLKTATSKPGSPPAALR
jgi:hypothetical protein